jgi:hypothetical protein
MPQLGAALHGPDRPHQQSLPCWSASIRSSEEQDRSRHHSAHRGARTGVEHWDGAVRGCVSVDPVLSGCVCGVDGWCGVQYAPRWLYSAQKDRRGALHYQSELSQANLPCGTTLP